MNDEPNVLRCTTCHEVVVTRKEGEEYDPYEIGRNILIHNEAAHP